MYKIVLQIPKTDEACERLEQLHFQGPEGPHGPHIKTYHMRDAETKEEMLFIRLKHHSWEKVNLMLEEIRRIHKSGKELGLK